MTPTIHVVGAAITRDQGSKRRCLVARRAAGRQDAGLWEFPGGKVEKDESPEQALIREIREELALWIQIDGFLGRGELYSSDRHLILDVYSARCLGGKLMLKDHDQARWISVEEINQLRWAAADIPVLGALRACLLADSSPPRG